METITSPLPPLSQEECALERKVSDYQRKTDVRARQAIRTGLGDPGRVGRKRAHPYGRPSHDKLPQSGPKETVDTGLPSYNGASYVGHLAALF